MDFPASQNGEMYGLWEKTKGLLLFGRTCVIVVWLSLSLTHKERKKDNTYNTAENPTCWYPDDQ